MNKLLSILCFVFVSQSLNAQVSWKHSIKKIDSITFEINIKGKLNPSIKVLSIKNKDCPLGIETLMFQNVSIEKEIQEIIAGKPSSESQNIIYQNEIEFVKRYEILDLDKKGILQFKIIGCEELSNGKHVRSLALEQCYFVFLNQKYKTIYVGFDLDSNSCKIIRLPVE